MQKKYEVQIKMYKESLKQTKKLAVKEHQKAQKMARDTKEFRKDLEDVVQYYQDYEVLKVFV